MSPVPQNLNPPLSPSERQAIYSPFVSKVVLDMLRRVLTQARNEQLGGEFGGGVGGLYGAVPSDRPTLPSSDAQVVSPAERAALIEALSRDLRQSDARMSGETGGGYGGLADALLPQTRVSPGRQATTAYLSGVARPTLMDLLRALFAKAGGPVPPLNGREAVQPRRFTDVPPLER